MIYLCWYKLNYMKKLWLPLICLFSACAGSKKPLETALKNTPDCILNKIKLISTEPVQNPPGQIFSYIYNNKIVYYIPPVCCDQFSDLYDSNCVLMGHPDGGFSGRGDMLFPDFSSKKTDEKLIWQDPRCH